MSITARQYIDPSAAEYHYYSVSVIVKDETGDWRGKITRHLHTHNDFVVEVRPTEAPNDCGIRVSPDSVFLEA